MFLSIAWKITNTKAPKSRPGYFRRRKARRPPKPLIKHKASDEGSGTVVSVNVELSEMEPPAWLWEKVVVKVAGALTIAPPSNGPLL